MIKKIYTIITTFIFVISAVFFPTPTYAESIIGDYGTNLVSCWDMEEPSGDRIDSQGSNDLSPTNSPSSVTALIGDGVDLESSSSQYLSIANGTQSGLDVSGDYSIGIVLKRESTGANMSMVDQGPSGSPMGLRFNSDSTIVSQFKNTAGNASIARTSDTYTDTSGFYFIFTTVDVSAGAGGITIYVNGSSVGVTNPSDSATSVDVQSGDFHVGARDNSGIDLYFDGIVDQVAFYDAEVSSSVVSGIYNSGSGITCEDATTGTPGIPSWYQNGNSFIDGKVFVQ